ncbi:MAG: tRNA methyl transferase PRC-barrel domain-containing protein [Rikenellaceae bacterium]
MKILLAFSGGIDSCAAVTILESQGFEVEAVTIDMIGDEMLLTTARMRAAELGITLHEVNAREIFRREVVDDFCAQYLSGRTPAPCTRCNSEIKWRILAQTADRLGIEKIATGHYFQIEREGTKHYVARAKDCRKDQSYYLWGVAQSILARAVTPMGEMIKEDVKATSSIKGESMGVCFLGKRPYAEFLESRGHAMPSGYMVDKQGEVVSRHNGIARYTIGQKRGEGIPEGLRVVAIRGAENQIVVGSNDHLFHHTLHLGDCLFVDPTGVELLDNLRVMVRGLGLNPQGDARVRLSADSTRATIHLTTPAWAPAPGQPIVIYSHDRVVGGGYLLSSENA